MLEIIYNVKNVKCLRSQQLYNDKPFKHDNDVIPTAYIGQNIFKTQRN